MEGVLKLQLSARSVGLFEAFYSSIKPMQLMSYEITIAQAGKVPSGVTEFPFEFAVVPTDGASQLYETYHGVYVNVSYVITVDCQRGMLSKSLHRECEFMVEVPHPKQLQIEEAPFDITPDTLENVKKAAVSNIPKFRIVGKLHRTNCQISMPFTGEISIDQSQSPVKSIELQLVRVETVAYAEGTAREATEIQNIQLAEGNVCRNLVIPIYMIFPRLFTCPTVDTLNFKVEFEVNLVVLFANGYMVTENFPLFLYR